MHTLRLFVTITRYFPAIGGAEIHTRELLRNLKPSVRSSVAANWSTNRTDWLLGTTLRAPLRETCYEDEGRPVHLIRPTLAERVLSLPLVLGYYPLQSLAATRLGHVMLNHLLRVADSPIDLVHNIRVGREPLSLASLELARIKHVPFVFTPNHHPRWMGWRYRVYSDLYRRADALIALTEYERGVLIGLGVRPERVHVTGIGPVLAADADPQRVRCKYGLNKPFVLFLGQKYPYKGAAAVLAAGPAIWARHPDVELVFVGPRTRHSAGLFAYLADARVRELPAVDLQDKTDLLRACELVCVPSTQESFGGVLVEGWASGKPVIGGPAPAVAEVIDDGKDGFYLSSQSPVLIAERVMWLLDNPSAASEFGQAGARKVQERFTWDLLATKTEAIYRSVR